MDVLADARALGERGDHGRAKVLRVRAREADPLDARNAVARAQELAELGSDRGSEVPPPRVHVLPEQRDLPDPLLGEGVTSATISPGLRLCSRPRTAGTMQYAHFELQPIDTCTQAW